MEGVAYGARSGADWMGDGIPILDVELPDDTRVLVAVETWGTDIAERIIAANLWEDLPVVTFEEWQIVGEGRPHS